MELRPYQQEAIDLIEGNMMFGPTQCCLAAPTSFGKTITVAHLINDLADEGKSVVFMMNLISLVSQTCKALDSLDIKYNVISSTYKGKQSGPSANVTIMMQQTFDAREKLEIKCDVLIIDEMHISHNTASMERVKERLRPTNVVGLSATPIDGKGLRLQGVDILETINTRELTKQKFLTPVSTIVSKYAQNIDLSSLGTGDDYTDPEIDEALNNPEYNQDVFDCWSEIREGKELKTIVFVSTISHAETLAKLFIDNGIVAQEYHSKMKKTDRETAMNMFKSNVTEVMISVSSLIAGFDMPDIQCGVMCRPTKRIRTYLQAVGRIMRADKGKKIAYWLDCAQVTQEHGFYDKPYHFKIEDKYALKKYKEQRRVNYINYHIKDEPYKAILITESGLEVTEYKITSDSSTEALIQRYDACMEIEDLLELGFKIAKSVGQPSTNKSLHFVEQTCIPYVREGGSFKAIKTRMRNIIQGGKKLASLHYFPKWLKENQSW